MKKSLSYLSLLLGLVLIQCQGYSQHRTQADFEAMLEDMYKLTVPLIHADELQGKGTDNYVLLDAREPGEFDVSHLEGARFAGYNQFDEAVVKDLPKDKPIVVYCSVGYRSERIGEKLQKMGFTEVYNLYGGIFDWKNQGFEVVNKENQPTESVHAYNQKWGQWLFRGVKVF